MRARPFILTILLSLGAEVFGQTVLHRPPDVPVDKFLSTFSDTLDLAHQVIQTSTHDSPGRIYLYFAYNTTSDTIRRNAIADKGNRVIAYSLITYDTTTFYCVTVDTLGFDSDDGISAEINAVFFANCDSDKENELFIMDSTFYDRHGLAGYVYRTSAYDFPTVSNMSWKKNEDISALFDYADIGTIDNPDSVAIAKPGLKPEARSPTSKYNSEASIKQKLKKLGY